MLDARCWMLDALAPALFLRSPKNLELGVTFKG
jgi:hypothetical protein